MHVGNGAGAFQTESVDEDLSRGFHALPISGTELLQQGGGSLRRYGGHAQSQQVFGAGGMQQERGGLGGASRDLFHPDGQRVYEFPEGKTRSIELEKEGGAAPDGQRLGNIKGNRVRFFRMEEVGISGILVRAENHGLSGREKSAERLHGLFPVVAEAAAADGQRQFAQRGVH